MKIAGLFAGIGGIEHGLHQAMGNDAETVLLCEWWAPAQAVLRKQFPGVVLHDDVQTLRDLPEDLDLLTAGFPCTDLSQAGRTAGIEGKASGMVAHVFAMLTTRRSRGRALPEIVIENVPNMLPLDGGRAMRYLVNQLEALGYAWAYRVVDSRFTGLPQRRRRVILFASQTRRPQDVLFAQDAGERPSSEYDTDAFGFYWTEGRGGLGWAQDAIPTLKSGSTIGIASPPAIWVPNADGAMRFVTPRIEEAEALQGFPRGWTDTTFPDLKGARIEGARWKMAGNAVTARVSQWLGTQLMAVDTMRVESVELAPGSRWPTAAFGANGQRYQALTSEYPVHLPYEHLSAVVDLAAAKPLSSRAMAGFGSRLLSANLGQYPGFRDAVAAQRDEALTLLPAR